MVTIDPPTERRCERCGRVETWDEGTDAWVAVERDGDVLRGNSHCVHVWNITGSYNPIGNTS